MKVDESLLSTSDNPFNPWSNWDAWLQWDMTAGYNTLAYLSRIAVSSDELSDADQELAITQAIDEIISEHSDGLYIKVAKPQS